MLGQSMVQRTEEESEYGEHYRVSLDEMLNLYDTLVLGLELPHERERGDQPQDRAILSGAGVWLPRRAREEGIRTQADRGERHPRLPADRHAREFPIPTCAGAASKRRFSWRSRPNTKIVIIGSGKDGLPVILGNVDTPMQPNPARAGGRAVPDNSEAARQRPAGASPPLLEKTPASNLPSPPERPSPTAVPRAPAEKPSPGASRGAAGTRARRWSGQAVRCTAWRAALVMGAVVVGYPGPSFRRSLGSRSRRQRRAKTAA